MLQRATAPSTSTHMAVCFYGMLVRFKKPKSCYLEGCRGDGDQGNVWLTEHVAHASFITNVISANAWLSVDTFLHTWDTVNREFVQKLYRPRLAHYGPIVGLNISRPLLVNGWPRDATPPMFASIEHVLKLKRRAEAEQGYAYDWVLITRFDVVWLFSLPLVHMNRNLLYMANWCIARDLLVTHDHLQGEACYGLAVKEPSLPPDYYFAGNSTHMDRFFTNLTRDLESFQFFATRNGVGNHKVVAGRIRQLKNPIGRALYHQMDLAVVRDDNFNLDRRLSCVLQQGAWGGRAAFDRNALLSMLPQRLPPPLTVQWTAQWRSTTTRAHHDIEELKHSARMSICPSHVQLCLCSQNDWTHWILKRQQQSPIPAVANHTISLSPRILLTK